MLCAAVEAGAPVTCPQASPRVLRDPRNNPVPGSDGAGAKHQRAGNCQCEGFCLPIRGDAQAVRETTQPSADRTAEGDHYQRPAAEDMNPAGRFIIGAVVIRFFKIVDFNGRIGTHGFFSGCCSTGAILRRRSLSRATTRECASPAARLTVSFGSVSWSYNSVAIVSPDVQSRHSV